MELEEVLNNDKKKNNTKTSISISYNKVSSNVRPRSQRDRVKFTMYFLFVTPSYYLQLVHFFNKRNM